MMQIFSVSRLRPFDSFLGTLPDALKTFGTRAEYLNIDQCSIDYALGCGFGYGFALLSRHGSPRQQFNFQFHKSIADVVC